MYLSSNGLYFLLLAVFALSIIASNRVNKVFKKFSNEPAASGRTGAELARELMVRYGTEELPVQPVSGSLTDHFDPVNKTVGLSQAVYGSDSVSALAVTAHEIGHVLQYQENYAPIVIRNKILPVASISSTLAPYIVIIGVVIGASGLAMFGALLFGAVLLFQLVTLPVEFNASNRGIEMLASGGYLSSDQIPDAQQMLRAAAMTYVWAAVASLINFLRFFAMAKSSDRRRR